MRQKRTLTVHVVGDHPTLRFASKELAKYLSLITGERATVQEEAACGGEARVARLDRRTGSGLWLGLASTLPVQGDGGSAGTAGNVSLPPVKDPRFDDAIAIRTNGANGVIAGNNPRSVLLAVYRYLTEAGCGWVRPGPDGEYVPRRDIGWFW